MLAGCSNLELSLGRRRTCRHSVLLVFGTVCRLLLTFELIVYKGIRHPSVRPFVVRPSVCQHFQTTSSLKPRSRFFSYFTYSIYRSGGTNNCVFCSGRIRTLVAIATYSSHRLIMGKEEIDNFFCLIWDIWIFFKEMFIE